MLIVFVDSQKLVGFKILFFRERERDKEREGGYPLEAKNRNLKQINMNNNNKPFKCGN